MGNPSERIEMSQVSKTPIFVVPEVGLEPTRPCGHWILNPARLPIPPLRLLNDAPHQADILRQKGPTSNSPSHCLDCLASERVVRPQIHPRSNRPHPNWAGQRDIFSLIFRVRGYLATTWNSRLQDIEGSWQPTQPLRQRPANAGFVEARGPPTRTPTRPPVAHPQALLNNHPTHQRTPKQKATPLIRRRRHSLLLSQLSRQTCQRQTCPRQTCPRQTRQRETG